MDVEPRVRFLLEELVDSERTPEEVCRDCPELLPEVRRRWRRKLACDAQLDAMFPARIPELVLRGSRPRPICSRSRVMNFMKCWAAAAWASFIGRVTCASTAALPSRCC